MQLEGEMDDNTKLVYRCMRKRGGKHPRTDEVYTGACHYHEFPYPADEYAYWHRGIGDKPTKRTAL
jgi:hypothetical protein